MYIFEGGLFEEGCWRIGWHAGHQETDLSGNVFVGKRTQKKSEPVKWERRYTTKALEWVLCAAQIHCQDQSPSSLSYRGAGIIMCGWRLRPSSDPALCLRELPRQRPLPLPRGSPVPWRWGCEGTKTQLWRAMQLQGSLCEQMRPLLCLHLLLLSPASLTL